MDSVLYPPAGEDALYTQWNEHFRTKKGENSVIIDNVYRIEEHYSKQIRQAQGGNITGSPKRLI